MPAPSAQFHRTTGMESDSVEEFQKSQCWSYSLALTQPFSGTSTISGTAPEWFGMDEQQIDPEPRSAGGSIFSRLRPPVFIALGAFALSAMMLETFHFGSYPYSIRNHNIRFISGYQMFEAPFSVLLLIFLLELAYLIALTGLIVVPATCLLTVILGH